MGTKCYEKQLTEPWFSWVKNNIKTVIGRPNCGDIHKILPGDTIIWFNDECGHGSRRYLKTKVIYTHSYKNFKEMIDREGLKHIASIDFVKTEKKTLDMLKKCYSKKIIEKYGVLAIKIKVLS